MCVKTIKNPDEDNKQKGRNFMVLEANKEENFRNFLTQILKIYFEFISYHFLTIFSSLDLC